jgi:hypothetical protein
MLVSIRMPSLACSPCKSKEMAEGSHRIRKIDRCPFLDTALLFLFAIVETNIQIVAPHIQEFYDFSKSCSSNSSSSSSSCNSSNNRINNSSNISNRTSKSIAFQKTLHILGFSHKAPNLQTCVSIVLEALFAYTRFLEATAEDETVQESALNALKYYLSRYFPTYSERVAVCNLFFLRRMKTIQTTYIPYSFTEENSGEYLKGMKKYFRSSEFKIWWNLFEIGNV